MWCGQICQKKALLVFAWRLFSWLQSFIDPAGEGGGRLGVSTLIFQTHLIFWC